VGTSDWERVDQRSVDLGSVDRVLDDRLINRLTA
jgi:hypothetical protein